MLGKLIKHEWKAVSKVLITIHISLLLMAVLGKIMLSIEVLKKAWPLWSALLFIYVISVIAVGIGTHIYLAVRFYKNMYTDEGYLSFTLPVKPWEHIFSKTLISSFWILMDGVIIVASILILVMYQGMGREFLNGWNEFVAELGVQGLGGVWLIIRGIFTGLLALISTPLTYYFSISIGQLFNSHKMLASVVSFFITINVIQVISTVVSAVFMIGQANSMLQIEEGEMEVYGGMLDMYDSMLGMGIVMDLIVVIGFLLVINYIMNKKLNLE